MPNVSSNSPSMLDNLWAMLPHIEPSMALPLAALALAGATVTLAVGEAIGLEHEQTVTATVAVIAATKFGFWASETCQHHLDKFRAQAAGYGDVDELSQAVSC